VIRHHLELHRIPGRGPGFGASSKRLGRPKSVRPRRRFPLDGADRGRAHPPGYFRARARDSRHRSSAIGGPLSRKPPPTVEPRWNPATGVIGSTGRTGARRAVSGVGRLLPWGSVPFGVSSPGDRCIASVCLADAIRSQGFSPSQRFEPAWTVWLCFAPLPPLGFCNGLQSFSRAASRGVFQHPLLSCRSSWFSPASSDFGAGFRPCLRLHLVTLLSPPASSPAHRTTRAAGSDISSSPISPHWSEIEERASGPNR
jgi:hypothetical protein